MRPIAILFLLCGCTCVAQKNSQPAIPKDTAQWQLIELRDGSRLVGRVIDRDDVAVLIYTRDLGDMRIANERIVGIRELPGSYSSNGFAFENPNTQTYFASASAIPLRKGEVRYTNLGVFGNAISVGVTKNLTMGAGAELFSLFKNHRINAGGGMKIGFQIGKRIHIAASGLYQQAVIHTERDRRSSNYDNRSGFAAGHFTYSNNEWNVTATAGYVWTYDYFLRGTWLALSGMARATTRVAFIMENMMQPRSMVYQVGFGMRYLARTAAFDLGVAFSNEYGPSPLPLPFVGWSVRL